jgi:uncharacterized protein YndB with AHSA1/START domain
MANDGPVSAFGQRVLVITRRFAAPPRLVFRAWTEPDLIVRWSTLRGFTMVRCDVDARVGGVWRCGMQSPEGSQYWVGGSVREIIDHERLMLTHAWSDADRRTHCETLLTIEFSQQCDETELMLHQAHFASVELRNKYCDAWNDNLDRLADELADAQRSQRAT